ncbi:MAG: adenine phosphoribosyltransferase [Ruminococcaceae bacterium]|nr:adenine phosphoribosyltransferase [Oscillospiraceae bacterium]
MTIAGLERKLQLFKISDNLQIAAFILFGDVEITKHAAAKLLELAPEYDIIFTAECKSLPLIYEMAAQNGDDNYIIARKAPKLYMENVLSTDVNSITTANSQKLFIGQADIDAIKGKRVLIVDDVISTGESLTAMEELIEKAGGIIVGKMAVLAEGNAKDRDDIIYLEPLPLFDSEGNPLK